MKKTQYKSSKFQGKGFYIALAVSLLAVAVATTIAISRTVSTVNKQRMTLSSQQQSNEEIKAANDNTSDLEKEESSVSSESEKAEQNSVSEAAKTQTQVKFAMPLDGEIINDYSNGELVKSETMGDWRTHDGIDIASKQSTPVKSIADGTVKEIKNDGLWGTCIIVDHGNGIESIYCGLNEAVNVKVDQKVKLGDVLASVGKSNELENALPDHLHLGMKKDGKWVNPHDYIK